MSKFYAITFAAVSVMLVGQNAKANHNGVLCDVNNTKFQSTDVVKSPIVKVKEADIFLIRKNEDGSFSTFIGNEKYPAIGWDFPGGKCTSSHMSPQATAKQELGHDTAGHVTVNRWILEKAPTLYSPKANKAIFLVRDDRLTTDLLKDGANHHSLEHWHKGFGPRELSEIKEVDLRHFMAKLQDYSKVVNAQQNDPKKLELDAKDGTHFEFSSETSLALADKYDLLRNLLTQISGSQF